ncbi:MAG: ATP-dependent DNA ligase [Candidatus Thorarchaeota archaeon]|nr:MAG: ATP-dependent DNA ligase [Candidatus Thorarchaeota archaeon]
MSHFAELAKVLDDVSIVSGRNKKINLLAQYIRELSPEEVSTAVYFLSGKVFSESDQRTLDVSWAGIKNALHQILQFKDDELGKHYEGDTGEMVASLLESLDAPRQISLFDEPLTLLSVRQGIDRISSASGKGSRKEKEAIIARLITDASPREARYLVAIILGDLRTGASEGIVAEAIAKASGLDPTLVRRAWQLLGDLGEVAQIAMVDGESGLSQISIRLMRPVKPMLAAPQEVDALEELVRSGEFALELKLDGARVQIHKDERDVRIFSRRLLEVTESLPEIVELVQEEFTCKQCVLDGEVVPIDDEGRPYPFQVVMRRFGRVQDVEVSSEEVQLSLHIFDVLFLDGKSLVDEPNERRRKILEGITPSGLLIERLEPKGLEKATEFFERSRELGHEGLVAKRTDSPYLPGVRGKNWFKIKHTLETVDLMVIAVEWGHGRRSKWLSDYHLAVWDEDSGEYAMVGKTFKGLTDKELEEMTRRFLSLKTGENRHIVQVQPAVVVEVLASEIQTSPTYKSGMALRFARIVRIRDDKGPSDVMKLEELKRMFDEQFRFKAR